MVLLLLGIPWPFRGDGVGRSLVPGMTAPAATSLQAPSTAQGPPTVE